MQPISSGEALETMHVQWMNNRVRHEKICVCGASCVYGEVLLSPHSRRVHDIRECLYAKSIKGIP